MVAQSSAKPISYNTGELIWMSTTNCHLQGNQRFHPKWFGRFEVIEVMTNACRLRFPSIIKLHPVINTSYLKRYIDRKDDDPVQVLKEPKILDWSKEFEVRRILNHRRVGRGIQFLVEWQGWKEEEATWEASSNLKNAPQVVMEYLQEHPEVPKPHWLSGRKVIGEESVML